MVDEDDTIVVLIDGLPTRADNLNKADSGNQSAAAVGHRHAAGVDIWASNDCWPANTDIIRARESIAAFITAMNESS